jgi:hypothetical protein
MANPVVKKLARKRLRITSIGHQNKKTGHLLAGLLGLLHVSLRAYLHCLKPADLRNCLKPADLRTGMIIATIFKKTVIIL